MAWGSSPNFTLVLSKLRSTVRWLADAAPATCKSMAPANKLAALAQRDMLPPVYELDIETPSLGKRKHDEGHGGHGTNRPPCAGGAQDRFALIPPKPEAKPAEKKYNPARRICCIVLI